ncbi:hypothetical protein ACLOJK_029444 [Asimina triloba]
MDIIEPIVLTEVKSSSSCENIHVSVTFGSNPSSIMLLSHKNRCEVITLGSSMKWRELSVPYDGALHGYIHISVVGSQMHWFADQDGDCILFFDLGSLTFQLIGSPSQQDDEWSPWLENLGGGCLAVTEFRGNKENLRVWFLVDKGRSEWTQIYSQVDVVVTTAGGIEEDVIKCLAHTYRGDFLLPGAYLRSKGLNRTGNLLVPNDNNCKFEDWIIAIFDQMLQEQFEKERRDDLDCNNNILVRHLKQGWSTTLENTVDTVKVSNESAKEEIPTTLPCKKMKPKFFHRFVSVIFST